MMSGKDALLCTLLNCGSADLAMLDQVDLDWDIVLNECDRPVDFNGLMQAVVLVGTGEIANAVIRRKKELRSALEEGQLTEDEATELEDISTLNPYDDISSYHNWLDTYAYFEQREEIYRRYFSGELDTFEDLTGLCL